MNYRSNFGNPVAVNHDRLLWVRDLPDADGPGYVSLNGEFGERIGPDGQTRTGAVLK
jgi:hypothetical protein